MQGYCDLPYFFDKGVHFECQKCGACCTGDPGTVYVAKDEILTIAEFINFSVSIFKREYLYPFRDSYSIKEENDGRCRFYEYGCLIYPVRPLQCQVFPFWFENLRSPGNWKRVSRECPGIGQGRLYPREEILKIIDVQFTETR